MVGTPEHFETCLLCQRDFHFGHNRYDGRWIERLRAYICTPCLQGNWDGLANPEKIKRLFDHLDELGIPHPEPNAKGWIPLG